MNFYTGLPIDRFIRAMLDVPPNPRTGFIEKMGAEDLRWFIAGEDRVLGPKHVPYIVRRGMTPVPTVTATEIQAKLEEMERKGLVLRLGRWYAWKDRATPRARLKQAIHAPFTTRQLRKLAREGERLRDIKGRPAGVPDALKQDLGINGLRRDS